MVPGGSPLSAGTWLQPEISARVPLGKNSPYEAEKQLLQLKLKRLELSLDEMEAQIRAEVSAMRVHYESSVAEAPAARQALALAQEYRKVIAARWQAGLETVAALNAAQESEHVAQVHVVSLEHAARSSFAAMLSLCGLNPQPLPARSQLLTMNEVK
jgi:outer membrane protein TolC